LVIRHGVASCQIDQDVGLRHSLWFIATPTTLVSLEGHALALQSWVVENRSIRREQKLALRRRRNALVGTFGDRRHRQLGRLCGLAFSAVRA
jgi:hypothetical protein